MIGYLAKSLMGHDAGRIYVIVGESGNDVMLADGTVRTKDKPKKKNIRHIQLIKIKISTDSNEAIKQSISQYNTRRTVDV